MFCRKFNSENQTGFAFLVPAHLGSPGKRAVKRVCVCDNSEYCSRYEFYYDAITVMSLMNIRYGSAANEYIL